MLRNTTGNNKDYLVNEPSAFKRFSISLGKILRRAFDAIFPDLDQDRIYPKITDGTGEPTVGEKILRGFIVLLKFPKFITEFLPLVISMGCGELSGLKSIQRNLLLRYSIGALLDLFDSIALLTYFIGRAITSPIDSIRAFWFPSF